MSAKRNLVFLGAPGAGKGTLADMLGKDTGITHISTGDLFRAEIANDTELGRLTKHYVTSGGLVPDALVVSMLGSRLRQEDCLDGFMLDGFPRTVPQADLLEFELRAIERPLDTVVLFEVAEDLLLKRLTARVICRNCQAVFNIVYAPPKKEGVCDSCGMAELYQRPDDSLETATDRLRVYNEQTAPLIDYYESRGLLRRVEASREKHEVFKDLLAVLV